MREQFLTETGQVVNLFMLYQFLKRLTTPFDETDAFALGIIDERGKRTKKKMKTKEEKESWRMFDRLVFRLKQLLEKLPLGRTRLASYAAALILIKEQEEWTLGRTGVDTWKVSEQLKENMVFLEKNATNNFRMLREGLDEEASVYKKTARKNKNDVTYAFGRTKKLDGQPKENGGYWVWKLSKNYDGKVRGGIRNSWVYVAKDLSYSDAVKLMNKKLGRKEFKEEVELDEEAPANTVGSGAIAGAAPGEDPPVRKNKKRKKKVDDPSNIGRKTFSHFMGEGVALTKKGFEKEAKKLGKLTTKKDDGATGYYLNGKWFKTIIDGDSRRVDWDDVLVRARGVINELAITKPIPSVTLGIPRRQMPQVKSTDYPELLRYLQDSGAHLKNETISANKLNATQKDFSDSGIAKSIKKGLDGAKKKALIASKEGFIVDGHHRWLAAMNTSPDKKIPIIRVNMPIKALMKLMIDFPKTTFKAIYESVLDDELSQLGSKLMSYPTMKQECENEYS